MGAYLAARPEVSRSATAWGTQTGEAPMLGLILRFA